MTLGEFGLYVLAAVAIVATLGTTAWHLNKYLEKKWGATTPH